MLKRLLVLLLAVMILPVFADATWQEIQNKNKALYIDTSSITNQDALYLYWVKRYSKRIQKDVNEIRLCKQLNWGSKDNYIR